MSAAAPQAPEAAKEPAKKSGGMTRLIVLAFILAVIGGECLMAALYLPNMAAAGAAPGKAEEADEHHSDKQGEKHHGEGHGHGDDDHESAVHHREVDLGQYTLTAFQAATNSTLVIDFHLYGTVAVEHDPNAEEAEPAADAHGGGHGGHDSGASTGPKDEFTRLYDKNKHRIRDAVITIIRSAEMGDFTDPSLGLIRRRILEKSNRALGKPLLQEVIFSEFSLIEQ